MNQPLIQTSFRDLAIIFFRRKWGVFIILLTVLVSAIIWLWLIRAERYEVTAKVLVRLGYEQSSSPTVIGEKPAIMGQRSQDVKSEVDILQSTDLLGKVVDHLRLDQPTPQPVPPGFLPRLRYEVKKIVKGIKEWTDEFLITLGFRDRLTAREKVIYQLEKGLFVGVMTDSNVVLAKLSVPARKGGGVILNTLIDFYQVFRLKAFQDPALVDVLFRQVDESSAKLKAAEEQLRRFENESDIIALETQKDLLLRRIADAQSLFTEAEIALNEAQSKVNRLDQVMKMDGPDFATLGSFDKGSYPDSLLHSLAFLDKEREALRMNYLDSTVRIQNNRSQSKMLLSLLSSNLKSTLAEKKDSWQARKEIVRNLKESLDALHDRKTRWDELRRIVQVLENEYLLYRKRLTEGTVTKEFEHSKIGNVAVIQSATDPLMQAGMRKTTLLAFFLFFAVFGSAVWIALAEFFDHHIYSPEEAELHAGAPVLASVPETPALRKSSVDSNEIPEITEGFRKTALHIARSFEGSGPAVFLFTGTAGKAGTSTTVLGTALQLRSYYALRTLVVSIRETGSADAVGSSGHGTVTLSAHGLSGGSSQDLAEELRKTLAEYSEKFDVILIDAPPISGNAGAFANIVSQYVLVAEAGRTRSEVLERISHELRQQKITLSGVVLNRRKYFIPGWIYRLLIA